jgi:hypothetical protein
MGQLCQDLYVSCMQGDQLTVQDCLQTQYPQELLAIVITLLQDPVTR